MKQITKKKVKHIKLQLCHTCNKKYKKEHEIKYGTLYFCSNECLNHV